LIWDEFERLFKDKYLSKKYYDDKAKGLYKLQMGSMIDDEYNSRFLELLRYAPYLKDEMANFQRFISVFLVAYRDRIDFDEPRTLEEAIQKLKHCYQQLKRKAQS